MPARVPSEQVARIKELAAQGKSSRAIALETGVGKSSVARYMSEAAEIVAAQTIPSISVVDVEPSEMISDNAARSFLNDIGIEGPMKALRNDVVPVTNPLKNNPRALQVAQTLLRTEQPLANLQPRQERVTFTLPEPPAPLPLAAPVATAQPKQLDAAQMISRIQMNVENFAPPISRP